jgi:hypothetical protein
VIYKYTSPSGKVYIGQTKNERQRKYAHKSHAERGTKTAFCNAIRKYGFKNLKYEVIVRDVPDYMVNAFEKYWVHYYNSYHGAGYNLEEGGGNSPVKQETKDKISKKLKGTKQSDTTKYKRNTKLKNQKRTEEQKETYRKCQSRRYKRVLCVDTGKVYESIASAQRDFGVKKSHIGDVCVGKRNKALNHTWKFIK